MAARAVMYILVFGGDPITLESLSEEDANRARRELAAWWRRYRHSGKLVAGARLAGPFSATTVRFAGDRPLIEDGPFTAEAEAIGGFGIVDVADLDEALAIATDWPLGGFVEIRPLVSPARASEVVGYPRAGAAGARKT